MGDTTEVEFRTGVAEPIAYAARWLKVAVARGARVRVVGPDDRLKALDQWLWVADKEGFLPHQRAGVTPSPALREGLALTPVWLGEGAVAGAAPELLLGLGGALPQAIESYRRIVEIVGTDEADAHEGRQRWQAYRRAGHSPQHRAPEA